MKIAITGANGYLAKLIMHSNKDINFIKISHSQVDFSNKQELSNYISNLDFDVFCHFAAICDTKTCEEQEKYTNAINYDAVKIISDICQNKNKKLLFLSTEQVFNNTNYNSPITENAVPNSCTNYGNQKLNSEAYISSNNDNYVILRLSWMFGFDFDNIKSSHNIYMQVKNALVNKEAYKFKCNEKRSLTYAQNLANNFKSILKLNTGIYHFAANNDLSTYEAAVYIAKALGYDKAYIDQYILKDKISYQYNPRYIVLNNEKLKANNIIIDNFKDQVIQCINDEKKTYN